MAVSDILDGAFKLLKANAATLATVVGLLVVPFQVLGALAQRNLLGGRSVLSIATDPSTLAAARSTGNSVRLQVVSVLVALINLVLLPFVAGAISMVVSASYLGETLRPLVAVRAALRRFWALLAAWWLIHLMEWPALLLCIFPGIIVMTMFVLTAPAIVTEQLGPIEGMRRSWRLVRPRLFPVMGVALLAGLIASVLQGILGVVPTLAALVVGLHWGWIALAAGNSAVALVVTPFVAIVATLLYFDARIRNEGFDLEVIAAGLASGAG
jgi:hypothetical protein